MDPDRCPKLIVEVLFRSAKLRKHRAEMNANCTILNHMPSLNLLSQKKFRRDVFAKNCEMQQKAKIIVKVGAKKVDQLKKPCKSCTGSVRSKPCSMEESISIALGCVTIRITTAGKSS